MNKIINNQPLLIYGDGEQTRAFSYIDDNLLPFWKAATSEEASKQIINVGGIVPCTINEASRVLCKITGYDKVEHVQKRHEVKNAVPTYEKSINLLGYEQTTLLKEGLEKMWTWAKEQPIRKQYKWENYEITDGLYEYWK